MWTKELLNSMVEELDAIMEWNWNQSKKRKKKKKKLFETLFFFFQESISSQKEEAQRESGQ